MLLLYRFKLTSVQLVSDDDEESNAGAEGVNSDGDLTDDPHDLPTRGSHNLLIGALVTDLEMEERKEWKE